LISNDDGVHAPGVRALADAVEPLGDAVIVAPHVERSGAGQALSLTLPLRVERLAANVYAVDGTPADCIMLALNKLLDRRPDWVLSGINRGTNLGQDTLYSGTVAAAMEGCLHGIPAMAISLSARGSFAYADYADAKRIVQLLFEHEALLSGAGSGVLNVNIPSTPLAVMRGFAVAALGRRIYDSLITENVDPRGRSYYWIGGGSSGFEDRPGSDCNLLADGFITLSVLQPDHLHAAANATLAGAPGQRLNQALASLKGGTTP